MNVLFSFSNNQTWKHHFCFWTTPFHLFKNFFDICQYIFTFCYANGCYANGSNMGNKTTSFALNQLFKLLDLLSCTILVECFSISKLVECFEPVKSSWMFYSAEDLLNVFPSQNSLNVLSRWRVLECSTQLKTCWMFCVIRYSLNASRG